MVIYHLNILSTFMMRVNTFLKLLISKSYRYNLYHIKYRSYLESKRNHVLKKRWRAWSIEDFFLWDESDVRKKILRHIYYTVSSLLKNNMEKRNSKMDKTRNKEIKPSKSGLKDHIQKRKSVDILNLNSKFGMERSKSTKTIPWKNTKKPYILRVHTPSTFAIISGRTSIGWVKLDGSNYSGPNLSSNNFPLDSLLL